MFAIYCGFTEHYFSYTNISNDKGVERQPTHLQSLARAVSLSETTVGPRKTTEVPRRPLVNCDAWEETQPSVPRKTTEGPRRPLVSCDAWEETQPWVPRKTTEGPRRPLVNCNAWEETQPWVPRKTTGAKETTGEL